MGIISGGCGGCTEDGSVGVGGHCRWVCGVCVLEVRCPCLDDGTGLLTFDYLAQFGCDL